MNRVPLSLVVFLLAVVTTACSTVDSFVVVNRSGSKIEVEYSFKSCSEMPAFPTVQAANDFENSKNDWSAMPEEEFTFAEQDCAFSVSLENGHALLLDRLYNYHMGKKSERRSHFRLKGVTLRGNTGTVALTGEQVRMRFEEVEKTTLIYK